MTATGDRLGQTPTAPVATSKCPRPTKDKAKAIATCKKLGRKVIWSDEKGLWHCATDRNNTPHWASETLDV